MALAASSSQRPFPMAIADPAFEEQLHEAVEASLDDLAFRIQLEEVIAASTFQFAYELQIAEITGSGSSSLQLSSTNDAVASSSSSPSYEDISHAGNDEDYGEGNHTLDIQRSSAVKASYLQLSSTNDAVASSSSSSSPAYEDISHARNAEGNHTLDIQDLLFSPKDKGKRVLTTGYRKTTTPTPSIQMMVCGICYDDESSVEMYEGLHCLHRYCQTCVTRYIHTTLQERKHIILCPAEGCNELLTPEECKYFLPNEILEQWSTLSVEALIPESQKFYCPFKDCSQLLLNESAGDDVTDDIKSSECPFCNRLFCAQCKVPWHSGLECEEFQSLPEGSKTEADLKFFSLVDNNKWKVCRVCKRTIELTDGCNHMTCKCGHQFCYLCGNDWTGNSHICDQRV